MISREQFDALVRGVEAGPGRQPRTLRRRVALLALIGYAGLLAGLLGVIVIAGALAGLAFAVDGGGRIFLGLLSLAVLLAGGGSVLRVLLVRLEPPEGRVISRREAPQLYELLDELRRELRSAPFHQVLAGPMCNAAVVQVPRLGVLGWPRNY